MESLFNLFWIVLIVLPILTYMRQERAKGRRGVYLNIRNSDFDKILKIEQPFKKRVLLIFVPFFFLGMLLFPSLVEIWEDSIREEIIGLGIGVLAMYATLLLIFPGSVVIKSLWRSGTIILDRGTLILTWPLKERRTLLSDIEDIFIFHHSYRTRHGMKVEYWLIVRLKSGRKLQKELEYKSLDQCQDLVGAIYEQSDNQIEKPAIMVDCIMK